MNAPDPFLRPPAAAAPGRAAAAVARALTARGITGIITVAAQESAVIAAFARPGPVITDRNPDDALTDTTRPFPTCARAEESSHHV